jgi:hypothetical protein
MRAPETLGFRGAPAPALLSNSPTQGGAGPDQDRERVSEASADDGVAMGCVRPRPQRAGDHR